MKKTAWWQNTRGRELPTRGLRRLGETTLRRLRTGQSEIVIPSMRENNIHAGRVCMRCAYPTKDVYHLLVGCHATAEDRRKAYLPRNNPEDPQQNDNVKEGSLQKKLADPRATLKFLVATQELEGPLERYITLKGRRTKT